MCDYSLHSVASRPAKVGDKLVVTDFAKSITHGFAAVGEPDVAVCLLPGTEVAFEDDVQYDRAFRYDGQGAREPQSCTLPADQHGGSERPPRCSRISRRPDCIGHALDARPAGNCAAIAGAAHDRGRD